MGGTEKAPVVAKSGDDEQEDEFDDDQYMEDAAYRLRYGPNMELWGEYGLDESLVGLKIVFDFRCFGKCEGTVRSIKESHHTGESILNVIWTCEGRSEEEFPSELMANDVVAWHFHGRERPSWLDEDQCDRAADCAPLFSADTQTEMRNFDLPCDANDVFPWVKDEWDNRWRVTLCCLNDPECAHMYDPTGKMAYPLPLLLTIIVICREYDPSVKLPMIVSSEKKAVFELADKYARRLSKSGRRTGYKELGALEGIVNEINSGVKVANSANKWNDENWKSLYEQCEALILTLSEEFENDNDSWHYADDPERIDLVCAKLVLALGSVLLHVPSEAMKQLLSKDLAHISQHLIAGNFVQFVEDEDFAEEHCDAFTTWKQLTTQLVESGVGGTTDA